MTVREESGHRSGTCCGARQLTRRFIAIRCSLLIAALGLFPALVFAQGAPTPPLTDHPAAADPIITADPPASAVKPQAISPILGGDCAGCAQDPAHPTAEQKQAQALAKRDFFSRLRGDDGDGYSIVSVGKGLSTHKPMYFLPATWSGDYDGKETEVLFAISAKARLFGMPLYFGYSQKSFWQVYDADRSRPFRETDYNPELFYRFTPDPKQWNYWGADVGIEHESNGHDVPLSRSWNRVYFAPFRAKGKLLIYAKAWYRIPEDNKKTPDDPKGDDNPDLIDHYGYGELHFQRQIGKGQVIHTMVRMNPETGHGAFNLNYTIPSRDGSMFYQLYVWQGYGESLLDYNDSVTRVGLGIAFSR
ncbi:phospholipase A [Hydrocarboniphaga effusa]|uniref:phospholipase A n=1 Tax=Hydrocarboniphaga effusa TaxID=243629 RepID=UPI003137C11D